MSAKDYAVKDIRESLEIKGKCFLAFRRELDPIMDSLVEEQIEQQLKASGK